MSGLLGFLLTSAVLAAIGTAVRGLLRPVSWSLLALALSLFASDQLLRSRAEISDPSWAQSSPLEDSPIVTDDPSLAREGLQDAAEDLQPTIDRAFPPIGTSSTPPPTNGNANQPRQPPPQQTVPSPNQSPNTIQGLW